jgi:hypothetical protein
MIYRTQGEHADYYTTDSVVIPNEYQFQVTLLLSFFSFASLIFQGGGILKRENLTNTPNGDGHKMVTMTFIWCRCFTRDIKTLIYYTD